MCIYKQYAHSFVYTDSCTWSLFQVPLTVSRIESGNFPVRVGISDAYFLTLFVINGECGNSRVILSSVERFSTLQRYKLCLHYVCKMCKYVNSTLVSQKASSVERLSRFRDTSCITNIILKKVHFAWCLRKCPL